MKHHLSSVHVISIASNASTDTQKTATKVYVSSHKTNNHVDIIWDKS